MLNITRKAKIAAINSGLVQFERKESNILGLGKPMTYSLFIYREDRDSTIVIFLIFSLDIIVFPIA